MTAAPIRGHCAAPLLVLLVALFSAYCAQPGGEGDSGTFEHDLATGPTPWTHADFDVGEDDFTFAIASDLTGGERDGIFAVAAEQLAILRPELIMSVGDLIEGETEDPTSLAVEWDWFDERARRAVSPFFYVAGNHDATAVPLRDVWNERLGPIHYHFVYRNVLFLVLDTEDHTDEFRELIKTKRNESLVVLENEGSDAWMQTEYFLMPERETGQIRPRQADEIVAAIEANPDVRWTFVFMHKPIWRGDDAEWRRIEAALGDGAYSVFGGHLHNFEHEVRNGRDYTVLATTGGAQGATRPMAFDHVTLVRVSGEEPSVAHLRLDGILDRTGHLPAGGDTLCFQASRCGGGE